MKEDIFDNIIKEKMKGFAPGPGTDDVWSVFENSPIHKNQETIDDEFDKIIRSSLMNALPKDRGNHWQLMKSQLKTIEERKNTVVISKIMEFAAIFLIVFTFLAVG